MLPEQETRSCHAPQPAGWQLLELSLDCVKLLSADGRLVSMNKNGQCVMEVDDFTKVAGLPWKSFWPVESHAEIDRALAAVRTGGTGNFRASCPTAKGTPKWWDVVVTAIPGSDNGSVLAVSRDI